MYAPIAASIFSAICHPAQHPSLPLLSTFVTAIFSECTTNALATQSGRAVDSKHPLQIAVQLQTNCCAVGPPTHMHVFLLSGRVFLAETLQNITRWLLSMLRVGHIVCSETSDAATHPLVNHDDGDIVALGQVVKLCLDLCNSGICERIDHQCFA